jgi:signal transduction histidine kinase
MFTETMLLNRVRSEEERVRYLDIIDREARRLGSLAENVLQFSRGERGTLRLDLHPRDLRPLIQDISEGFRPLACRAGAVLETHLSGELVASVDENALRQILLNLLDNALKYGPEGQRIVVGAEGGGGSCRLWVEDEGTGVPQRERERIWEPFQRLNRHEAACIAGTGIGLSVVRELAMLQGGRCWVESAERGGARFVVAFRDPPSPHPSNGQ